MSKSAHSDPHSFSVPCKHCAALLHQQERICPFCGYDQGVPDEGIDGVRALSEFESPDTLPPLDDEQTLIIPRHSKQRRAPGHAVMATAAPPITLNSQRPAYSSNETFWQEDERPRASPMRWVSGLAISLIAAVVLFALTLALDYFYFDKRTEPGRVRAFQSDIAQVRAALSRGDLGAAERTLESLDADYADNPTLQPLREELDRRLHEQEARRAQLRDAAQRATQALGVNEPARAPTPMSTVADTAVATPAPPATSNAPAPRKSAPADSRDTQCNDALAALSLCTKDGARSP